jgi:hypothetical protein
MRKKHFFLCHASEDKEQYIYPLRELLDQYGITYWIDEAEIRLGDNITKKIGEGIINSRFVIVFITERFLAKNWPEEELNIALHLQVGSGETIVLPLLAVRQELVFQHYPLLINKKALLWTQGLDVIVKELLLKMEQDKEPYFKWLRHIEEIEVDESIAVNAIAYGEGTQIETIGEHELLTLQKEVKLPQEFTALFNEQQLQMLRDNGRLHFPRNITVRGQRSHQDTTVAVYICTDTFYFQEYDRPNNDMFEVCCVLDRGGIAAFVDKYGNLQKKGKFPFGDEFGGVGAIVAIEFRSSQPICRSRFVIVIRRGIRYPDDIWLSARTNRPITSVVNGDITKSRFIFQSRQPIPHIGTKLHFENTWNFRVSKESSSFLCVVCV